MKTKHINLEGKQVTYSHWPSKGPTVLCLHGLGSTKHSFLEINETLQHDYNLIALDLPGHGQTHAFDQEMDLEAEDFNQWLLKVVISLGLTKFHLLAHSWGASLALHFAAEYPERVQRLLLIDGGYHDFEWQDEYFRAKYIL